MPLSKTAKHDTNQIYHLTNQQKIMKKKTIDNIIKGNNVQHNTIQKWGITLDDIPSSEHHKIAESVKLYFQPKKKIIKLKSTLSSNKPSNNYVEQIPLNLDFPAEDLKKAIVKKGKSKGNLLTSASIKKYEVAIKSLYKQFIIKYGNTPINHFYWNLQFPHNIIPLCKLALPDNYDSIIDAILALSNYSPTYNKLLQQSHNLYQDENHSFKFLKAIQRKKNSNNEKLNIDWPHIIQLYNKIETDEPYSQKHLLIATMVLIPPLRDNWGNVKFCQQIPTFESGDQFDFYLIPQSKLFLFSQKDHNSKGEIIIDIPQNLHNILINSLQIHPREFVFTKNDNKSNTPFSSGLSALITSKFGFNITDFRKAATTHILDNPHLSLKDKIQYCRQMLHSEWMAINHYYLPQNTSNQN